MNLILEIPQSLAAALETNAKSRGVDVATYVIETLRSITPEMAEKGSLSYEQFQSRLQDLIDAHPKNLEVIDDSRESIYAGCGE